MRIPLTSISECVNFLRHKYAGYQTYGWLFHHFVIIQFLNELEYTRQWNIKNGSTRNSEPSNTLLGSLIPLFLPYWEWTIWFLENGVLEPEGLYKTFAWLVLKWTRFSHTSLSFNEAITWGLQWASLTISRAKTNLIFEFCEYLCWVISNPSHTVSHTGTHTHVKMCQR